MEEKRGFNGKKRFSSVDMVGESSMGTSDSKTTRMQMDSAELLKYWPVGLTGSILAASSPSPSSINIVIFSRETDGIRGRKPRLNSFGEWAR